MPKFDRTVMMPRAANKPEDYATAIEQMDFMFDAPGAYAILIRALIENMLASEHLEMMDEEIGYLKHFLPQYFGSLPEPRSYGDLPMPHRRGNKRWDIENHRWV